MKVLKTPIGGRPGAVTDERYGFGPFRLDCGTRELRRGDQLVALTPKAFDLLSALVTSGGRAVEKNVLMKLVWPDSFVGEDSLTQNIATLRKALGDAPDRPQYIVTVPRHGYRFAAAVQAMLDRADVPAERDTPQAAELPETTIDGRDAANGKRSADPLFDRTKRRRWARGWVAFSTVTVLVAAGLAVAHFRAASSNAPPAMLRFVVTPPDGTSFSPSASFLALSPNGRFLAFLASRPGEEARLWVRALDSLTARELTGTDGARGPFWSPDSRYLGFFAKSTLKKVSLLGEPPEVLGEAPSLVTPSGTWHRNGVILFSQTKGIYRTFSTGGVATPVTSVDRQRGEAAHLLPQFLPDGRHFVYTLRADEEGGESFDSWIVLRSLDSADDRRLFIARSQALYADRDYLLFRRDGGLLAQPFDVARLRLRGEPLPVPETEHVGFNPAGPRGMFSVSENGVLAYRTSAIPELGWFDRSGSALGWIGAAGFDHAPALSHDDQRLAISRYDPPLAARSLRILDIRRGGVASRFTSRPAWEGCPVWSPDDAAIIFARGGPEDGELYEKSSNGVTEERPLPHRPRGCPLDWSRDGRYLLYGARRGFGSPGSGLWLVPVNGGGEPKALDGTWPSGAVPQARISPNGRWLAYVSDASGRREIYVRSFPNGADGTWRVSSQGGIEPQWRADGRELFFLGADQKLMAAPVMTDESAFRAGTPIVLFSTDLDSTGLPISGRNQYVVTADGQRFLINQTRRDAGPAPVTVVVNWTAALKR